MRRRVALAIPLFALLWAGSGQACGPIFPIGYLYTGNEARVLEMPEGSFWHELERLTGTARVNAPYRTHWQGTIAADEADLKAALSSAPIVAGEPDALVQQYLAMRQAMKQAGDGNEGDSVFRSVDTEEAAAAPSPFDFTEYAALLDAIPSEFALYVRGAAAYRAGDCPGALAQWAALLELPEAERLYRSTWAAFMSGKGVLRDDPARAIEWFERTRALAAAGCHDSLGLAPASLGWQAMAEEATGDRMAALRHYVEMYRSGSPHDQVAGYISARWMCSRLLAEREIDPALVADPACCEILTAWAVACAGWPRDHRRWVTAVAASGVQPPASLMGRLAWAAYRAGDMPHAGEWAAQAAEDDLYAKWVAAKLLLREGKLDEAFDILRVLTAAFPQNEEWTTLAPGKNDASARRWAHAELGVLLLGRQDYVAAFDALLRAGLWFDAAYVAERVLTLDELEAYVADLGDDPELASWGPGYACRRLERSPIEALRYLTARRLARNGRFDDAGAYYPEHVVDAYDWRAPEEVDPRALCGQLAALLAAGRDEALPARTRAERLFEAGTLMRAHGMELVGSEVEPDWAFFHGLFELVGATGFRLGGLERPRFDEIPEVLRAPLAASAGEAGRAAAHAITPDKRFHYRYRAADLMWESAKLAPDNDPLTAKALYYGGVYLKDREPALADRFYKALVRRCRGLAIGQEADRLRWFPATPPE
ncbi:MAG: hypothetical protein JXR94_09205 [Candidatus Hydrogenedentes bacterium]|nr:hypothetical protein [Candidatus Hydrogenedentota bacterium]